MLKQNDRQPMAPNHFESRILPEMENKFSVNEMEIIALVRS